MPGQPYARRSARVLLLDSAGRLLLFRCQPGWFTPGGGVADGETPPVTACRELWEETGLAVDVTELGPPVAWAHGCAELGWVSGWFRDDFFFVQLPGQHRVDPSRWEPHERASILEARWWPLAELATTAAPIVPVGLSPLIGDLATGWRPATPVQLRWATLA